eukprot:69166-Prorocentrum_minimum.AAC.1
MLIHPKGRGSLPTWAGRDARQSGTQGRGSLPTWAGRDARQSERRTHRQAWQGGYQWRTSAVDVNFPAGDAPFGGISMSLYKLSAISHWLRSFAGNLSQETHKKRAHRAGNSHAQGGNSRAFRKFGKFETGYVHQIRELDDRA